LTTTTNKLSLKCCYFAKNHYFIRNRVLSVLISIPEIMENMAEATLLSRADGSEKIFPPWKIPAF
jgi:hypothetical protein